MSTSELSELYEQWKHDVEQKAAERTLQQALFTLYASRFGATPKEITTAVEATHDTTTLHRWVALFAARSAEEIAGALRAEAGPTISS